MLSKRTIACAIAEIVIMFHIKRIHAEMNTFGEAFRINIFETAGFMATVTPLIESILQLLVSWQL